LDSPRSFERRSIPSRRPKAAGADRQPVMARRGPRTRCCRAPPARRETADGVCAPAEADHEDPGPRLTHPDNGGVAVDDVGGDAESRRLACDVVEPAVGACHEERPARRLRPEPGVIESKLFPRVDVGVGSAARGAVELVDVRPVLVRP
jgi:hypothetical protein